MSKPLPQAFVGSKGIQHVQQTATLIPTPARSASKKIRAWARQHGHELDPDTTRAVTLHCRYVDGRGWLAKIAEQMSMTQALLVNWQDRSISELVSQVLEKLARPSTAVEMAALLLDMLPRQQHMPLRTALAQGSLSIVEELPAAGLLADTDLHIEFHGLFLPGTPQRFDAGSYLQLDAEAFQAFIWQLDFKNVFKQELEAFWHTSQERYALSARIAFLAACNRQVLLGRLSEQARSLAWRSAGVERIATSKRLADNAVQARLLNVYGYRSSDILCLSDRVTGLTLLYIPGSEHPLHEFADSTSMARWLARCCRQPSLRSALLYHFRAEDVDDGPFLAGLGNALKKLGTRTVLMLPMPTSGMQKVVEYWDPAIYVNYKADTYSPLLEHDLFRAVAQAQRRRSLADAEYLITSDRQLSKTIWRSYFYQSMNLLAPLLLVAPELIPLLVLGSAVQFGLGLDQALNDNDPQARSEGIQQAVFGALGAAPGLVQGAKAGRSLFGRASSGFIKPRRINGQIGYPLSPIRPPRLPEQAAAPFFEDLTPAAPLPATAPLAGDDILRSRSFSGDDSLFGQIGDSHSELVYDAEQDAFLRQRTLDSDRTGYIVDPSAPASGSSRALVPANTFERSVTSASRTATLRALGIDLPLPVDFAALGRAPGIAIPKQIFSLWVGDQPIGRLYLESLDHNLQALEHSEYRLRLYLSNASPTAHAENMALLASRIDKGLQVSTLEHQTFYRAFRDSEYFEQYQAAIDGNGGVACNFSSASDILRYRILHAEGGLYLDLDDHLLTEPSASGARASIDRVPLVTPLNNLLLNSPVSNADLGMYIHYNTSMIGSRPFNPLLNQISDEILYRYRTREGAAAFYTSPRPDPLGNPAGLRAYSYQLNQLTGPGVLNAVIERNLPELNTLRNATEVFNLPAINHQALFDLAQYQQARERLVPLERVADMGNANSWKFGSTAGQG
ncbi:dermonecrotic toxin domain-containing protein [Pseudomonas putida]|uniref:dermonecrotic toxin domain-containing protein n=1 Tax=Pseudomonas putida TaxID=303 RepID=UPI00383BBE92